LAGCRPIGGRLVLHRAGGRLTLVLVQSALALMYLNRGAVLSIPKTTNG
jgi:hypothetical protein